MSIIYKFGKSLSSNYEYLHSRIKPFNHEEYIIKINQYYSGFDDKKNCIMCSNKLDKKYLVKNRITDSIICENCGHFQVLKNLPLGFPKGFEENNNYEKIYPKLTKEKYQKRVNDIYKPKLDWALEVIKKVPDLQKISERSPWYEFGCGAGYFISAVNSSGLKIRGSDADKYLIELARRNNPEIDIEENTEIRNFVDKTNSVFCSFFVFEHIDKPNLLWDELSKLEKGTLLYFSVPLYGFSVLFDKICKSHFPRRFDAWNHTQLYTEESLNYVRKKSGFKTIAEWRFGQDIEDLLLSTILTVGESNSSVEKRIVNSIQDSVDSMQLSLDKAFISDAIHVIWQKV